MNNMATVDQAINKSMIFRCSGSSDESQILSTTFYNHPTLQQPFTASQLFSGSNRSAQFFNRSTHLHFALKNDPQAAAAAAADIAPLIICFQPTKEMMSATTLDITFTHHPTSFLNVNGAIYPLSAAHLTQCLVGSSPCPLWKDPNPSSFPEKLAENQHPDATVHPLAIRNLSPPGANQHSFHTKLGKLHSEDTVVVVRVSLISSSGKDNSLYLKENWLIATSETKKPPRIKYLLPKADPKDHIHIECVEEKKDPRSSDLALQELAEVVKATFNEWHRSAVFCLQDCTLPTEAPFRTTLIITPQSQKPLEYTATFAKKSEGRDAMGQHLVPTDPCPYLKNVEQMTGEPTVNVTLAHFKPDPDDDTADF